MSTHADRHPAPVADCNACAMLALGALLASERAAREKAERERDAALARATEAEGLLRKIVAHVNRAPDRECWAAIIEQVIKVVALLNAMKEEM